MLIVYVSYDNVGTVDMNMALLYNVTNPAYDLAYFF